MAVLHLDTSEIRSFVMIATILACPMFAKSSVRCLRRSEEREWEREREHERERVV